MKYEIIKAMPPRPKDKAINTKSKHGDLIKAMLNAKNNYSSRCTQTGKARCFFLHLFNLHKMTGRTAGNPDGSWKKFSIQLAQVKTR